MRTGLLWDIFCTVIDNHGDLGVCWRLTRQLRDAGHRVRLWVDDASALAWMAPAAAQGREPGIEVRPWVQASDSEVLASLPPAETWIEAFGCEIPETFVGHGVATRQHPPVWLNLEYLSAEAWVPRMHGLPSPVMHGPARGWTKHFFYPGFTAGTGGLLREPGLQQRQRGFDRAAWRARHVPGLRPGGRLISLFCYEPAVLPQLLLQLAGSPDHLLVTPGRPLAAMQQALRGLATPAHWSALPYTDQDGFDDMLWACDLNFVRGEDSLVRALWAGLPFVWHIYPQDDNAHHAKLGAFLDWLQAPDSLRHFHQVWNGIEAGNLPGLDTTTLADWARCAQAARTRLTQQQDLLGQLLLSRAAHASPNRRDA
ncbi:MAG: elongation factor P maturation arginine rhamnosyltransferase EarP [Limnohabitans sp.]